MEIKGKVIESLGLDYGTTAAGHQWEKGTLIIETEGQYPKKVCLVNLKNAVSFSQLAIGTIGTFHIEISSKEFKGRWYTSATCYKWEVEQPGQAPQEAAVQSATPTLDAMGVKGYQPQQVEAPASNEADDLPF